MDRVSVVPSADIRRSPIPSRRSRRSGRDGMATGTDWTAENGKWSAVAPSGVSGPIPVVVVVS